ncbi:hypothetical protein ACH47Z_12760 [Streptomyces sp. NPDC020192]|uniref:hypothetical protein n=1 Tax=Streptomyces sp. NPDC020192 TaxID=3365066 RepID=UPI00378BD806
MTVWAVAVAAGGALTLVFRDDARPPGPYRWERVDESSPPALPGGSPRPLRDYLRERGPCPTPSAGQAVTCR